MDKLFFAFSDCVEHLPNGKIFIRFDSFRSNDFIKIKDSSEISRIIYEVNTILLEIFINEKDVNNYFTGINNLNIPENQWFLIKFGNQGLNAKTYEYSNERAENEEDCKISQIILLKKKSDEYKTLKRKFSFPIYKNNISIQSIVPDETLSDVICLNVGQGNCNAILRKGCKLSGFFDFGGGIGSHGNKNTICNTTRNFLISSRDKNLNHFVILSHWDLDHFFHYKKHENDILNFKWIVPYYPLIGKSHYELIYKLNKKNNLFVWHSPTSKLSTTHLDLFKLSGNNKNNSGLALLLKLRSKFKVLLPGDASYKNIPIRDKSINGLVVSHHGGQTIKNDIPPKANVNNHLAAYSSGKNNVYGHPSKGSLKMHCCSGWINWKCTSSNNDIYISQQNFCENILKQCQILNNL